MTLVYKSLSALMALVTLATGAALATSQLQAFYFFHPHVPVRDTFYFLPLVQQALEHGPLDIPLSQWWQAHAGAHRVALPRLLMLADYGLLDGRNHLIQAATGTSLLVLLAIYATNAVNLFRTRPTQVFFVIGLCLLFLLSPSQAWNLFIPINASWYLVLAFSASAIALLTSGPDGPSPPQLVGAYLLALLAGSSNFAGTLLLLLIPIALYLRRSRWTLLCTLITSLLFWWYFPELAPTEQLTQPRVFDGKFLWQLLREILTYLGSPLTRAHPLIAGAIVSASLLYLAGSWLHTVQLVHRGRDNPHAGELLPLLMASLCLGVALATQMGRSIFSDPDAWRYQSVVMFYWLNICLLMHVQLKASLPVMTAICALYTALVLWPLEQPLPRKFTLWASAAATERAASSGMPQRHMYNKLLPFYSRDYLADHSTFLRSRNLSLFSSQRRQPQPCSQRVLDKALSHGNSIGEFYFQLAIDCRRGGPDIR